MISQYLSYPPTFIMGIFDGTYRMESSSNFVAAYVLMGLLDLIIIFKHQFKIQYGHFRNPWGGSKETLQWWDPDDCQRNLSRKFWMEKCYLHSSVQHIPFYEGKVNFSLNYYWFLCHHRLDRNWLWLNLFNLECCSQSPMIIPLASGGY